MGKKTIGIKIQVVKSGEVRCRFMKKIMWLLGILFISATMVGGFTIGQRVSAANVSVDKKAILVVSFGTTYGDTRKVTTDAVEDKIRAAFPEYEVRRAFTSRIIIKKLADRDGIQVDTEKQALDKLKQEGYTEVVVQPLHMEAGDEYEKLMNVVATYTKDKAFSKISVGRPVLYYTGQEEKPDDYLIAIKGIQTQLPKLGKYDAVAIMGHGGVNPSNTAYAALQMKLQDAGVKNVFVFTVEGYPKIENLIEKLKENKIKKVTLMPFMLVAGDHANKDMAGEEKESFKSKLLQAGFKVDTYLHGLGENKAIQDIYVQHVKDVIDNKYDKKERSKTRPAIPVIE
jgi:sirohydrochlorin cobaltochelatase